MCTWCIHSWAHLKYQDWFGTHSNMHHTYILCTSKQKSHISLKERWSETKVRRTLLHIWSTILSQYFFTLSLFESKQNHGVLFKLLNFWSLCLCLDKKNNVAYFWANFLYHFGFLHFAFVWPNFWSLEPIFDHVAFFRPIFFITLSCFLSQSLCLAPSGRYISVKVWGPAWNCTCIAIYSYILLIIHWRHNNNHCTQLCSPLVVPF